MILACSSAAAWGRDARRRQTRRLATCRRRSLVCAMPPLLLPPPPPLGVQIEGVTVVPCAASLCPRATPRLGGMRGRAAVAIRLREARVRA